jgi:hypothetical protein
MADVALGLASWERTMTAVEKVRERMLRAAAALEKARVAYAVIGGNAVATWVGKVDEAAVRFTRDVDLLIRRDDLESAKKALEPAGFIYRHVRMIDMFLDGPDSKVRDAVHLIFAGEKVRESDACPAPEITETESADAFRVLGLEALVRMKLTAFRDKDKTHLRDMLDVGLIDSSWPQRFSLELSQRLQSLLDTPEG